VSDKQPRRKPKATDLEDQIKELSEEELKALNILVWKIGVDRGFDKYWGE
jgi:hypothetical protein